MTDFACLLPLPAACERFSAAARTVFKRWRTQGRLLELSQPAAVRALAAQDPDVVFVLDPYHGGSLDAELIAGLMAEGLSSDVIVYGDFEGRPVGDDIPQLVALGVERIRTFDVDDTPRRLTADLIDAVASRDLTALCSELDGILDSRQRMVLRRAIRLGAGNVSVEQLASELGSSGRSMRRWCEGLGGLSAGSMIRWGRVLHAARVLAHTRTSGGVVAARLGFSSYGDLCRKFSALVGKSIRDVDRSELFEVAKAAFRGRARSDLDSRQRGGGW